MIIRLLTAMTLVCLASVAQAQNVWSVPGSACIPTDVSIQSNGYKTNLTSVEHAGTGVIVFMCQMDQFNSGTTTWNLKITYRDSTGTSNSGFVRARVYRMDFGSSVAVLLGEVSSNSSASTGLTTLASPVFDHTFDFETGTYWVRVDMKRTYSTDNVMLYSVVLDGTAV